MRVDGWGYLGDEVVYFAQDMFALPQLPLRDQNIAERIQSRDSNLDVVTSDAQHVVDAKPGLVPVSNDLQSVRQVNATAKFSAGMTRLRGAADGQISLLYCTPWLSGRVYQQPTTQDGFFLATRSWDKSTEDH